MRIAVAAAAAFLVAACSEPAPFAQYPDHALVCRPLQTVHRAQRGRCFESGYRVDGSLDDARLPTDVHIELCCEVACGAE
jgi:hypothetical protein